MLPSTSHSALIKTALADLDNIPFPLVRAKQPPQASEASKALLTCSASDLFPTAPYPEAALSGLLLRLGFWNESHSISQDIANREGSYWHAVAHRTEPDYANSDYWFRRVGQHAILPALYVGAKRILTGQPITSWQLKHVWDPFLFNKWCDEANSCGDSQREQVAIAIQQLEWDLLFVWCAAER